MLEGIAAGRSGEVCAFNFRRLIVARYRQDTNREHDGTSDSLLSVFFTIDRF